MKCREVFGNKKHMNTTTVDVQYVIICFLNFLFFIFSSPLFFFCYICTLLHLVVDGDTMGGGGGRRFGILLRAVDIFYVGIEHPLFFTMERILRRLLLLVLDLYYYIFAALSLSVSQSFF